MDNFVHIVGNLAADPTLRGTEDKPRATFTVMVNEKRGDEEIAIPVNVTAFGTLASNVVKTFKKGTRVVVDGRLNGYKKAVVLDGENKELSMLSVTASEAAPDLRWAIAEVTKVKSGGSGNGDSKAESAKSSAASAKASAAASDNADDF